jgi:hypothetical protein
MPFIRDAMSGISFPLIYNASIGPFPGFVCSSRPHPTFTGFVYILPKTLWPPIGTAVFEVKRIGFSFEDTSLGTGSSCDFGFPAASALAVAIGDLLHGLYRGILAHIGLLNRLIVQWDVHASPLRFVSGSIA